eukprot:308094-Chlamydomonas_euryale.AAC.5
MLHWVESAALDGGLAQDGRHGEPSSCRLEGRLGLRRVACVHLGNGKLGHCRLVDRASRQGEAAALHAARWTLPGRRGGGTAR